MKFYEWLDQQDMAIGRWEYVPEQGIPGMHHHELRELSEEETTALMNRWYEERAQ